MLRFTSCLAVLLVLVGARTVTAATVHVIDLDDKVAGEFLTDEYANIGAVFSPDQFFRVEDLSAGGFIHKPSSPNMTAITAGSGYITFVDPLDPEIPAVTDHFAFDNPGLRAGAGVFYAGLIVTALGLDDTILDFAVVAPLGPNQGRAIFSTSLDVEGIHRVRVERLENAQGAGFAGMDNISFNPTTPVPEPSTFILLTMGAVGLLAYAQRRRR